MAWTVRVGDLPASTAAFSLAVWRGASGRVSCLVVPAATWVRTDAVWTEGLGLDAEATTVQASAGQWRAIAMPSAPTMF